jgi:methylmalonyl-CoA mutase cobalamin-binding subunit/DNA-binding transcriptional MerR regulator
MIETAEFIPAFDVESATGLTNDLLRKWRQRYGFPQLLQDEAGRKGYSSIQIEQLRVIRRLLSMGFLPSQIVGRSLTELGKLEIASGHNIHSKANSKFGREAIQLLRAHDLRGLMKSLKRQRARITPTLFVTEVVAPFLTELGDAWARGDIKVYQEHLCSSLLTDLLTGDLLAMRPRQNLPRIILATPPDELHTLGLMMAQVALGDAGAECISLGPNIPVNEIVLAAKALKCDVIGVSISLAYPRHRILPFLRELDSLLPPWIEIWVGGAGAQGVATASIARIRIFDNLGAPTAALLKAG